MSWFSCKNCSDYHHITLKEMIEHGCHRLDITEKEDYVELVYIPPKKDKDESPQ